MWLPFPSKCFNGGCHKLLAAQGKQQGIQEHSFPLNFVMYFKWLALMSNAGITESINQSIKWKHLMDNCSS